MVLIYTDIISPRLSYITGFIFSELLGIKRVLTTNVDDYLQYDAIRVNYGSQPICDTEIQVIPHALLFQQDIKPQDITCFSFSDHVAFFKTGGSEIPFDLFAAAFYLLTRYEEYLPHTKDMYGRFAHEESLAFKENFLDDPVINSWSILLGDIIRRKFPGMEVKMPDFKFLPTYDIDIAFSFKHKGLVRSIGSALKSPSRQRLKVLARLEPDPYDAFEWMDQLHLRHKLQPRYFFLVAEKNGRYDKHILPGKATLRALIQHHSIRYDIGLHPSWQSGDDLPLLASEKQRLELISQKNIHHSRQHYIRFNLPAGYRRLLAEGITDEYSMGYGSINGFRASIASPFLWYDLEQDATTKLRIHPFCFMDANSFYEQRMSAQESYDELTKFYKTCRKVGGNLLTIWHNHFLGTDPFFKGYRDIYKKFMEDLQP